MRLLLALLVVALGTAIVSAVAPAVVEVYDIDGTLLAKHGLELDPSEPAPSGADVMTNLKQQRVLAWTYTAMGGKMIVNKIAGKAHAWPKTTWILSHWHAEGEASEQAAAGAESAGHGQRDGEGSDSHGWMDPNVNMAEVSVKPGDVLMWRLYNIGDTPKPLPKQAQPTPAADDEDGDEATQEL